MVDFWKKREKKILTAKSKYHNFAKILNFAKITNEEKELREWQARPYLENLVKVEQPERGDLIAFEEMDCFLGSTLFYLGIITDPKEMKILSQEHGKLTIENKQYLINEYVIPYLETSGYKTTFYRKK